MTDIGIQFKAKVRTMHYVDGTKAYEYIQVPKFTSAHTIKEAFSRHPRYHGLVNSSLMPNVLSRIRSAMLPGGSDVLRLDKLPENVSVDLGAFLAIVSVAI